MEHNELSAVEVKKEEDVMSPPAEIVDAQCNAPDTSEDTVSQAATTTHEEEAQEITASQGGEESEGSQENTEPETNHKPQLKHKSPRRKSKKVLLVLCLILLLFGTFGSIFSVKEYQSYMAEYHQYLSLAQLGIQDLET